MVFLLSGIFTIAQNNAQLEKAKSYKLEGNITEAIREYEEYLKENELDVEAYLELANCYTYLISNDTSTISKTISIFNKAIAINNSNAKIPFCFLYNKIADSYSISGIFFSLLVDIKKNDGDESSSNKEKQISDKLLELAVDYYEMAISSVPTDSVSLLSEYYQECADTYRRLSLYGNAEAYYHSSISLNNYNKDAIAGLGVLYRETGSKIKAVQMFKELIQIDSTDSRNYWIVAEIYREDGDIIQAEKYYLSYAKFDKDGGITSDNTSTNAYIGNMFYESGTTGIGTNEWDYNFKKAIEYYTLALNNAIDDNNYLYNRIGSCYLLLENYSEVIKNLKIVKDESSNRILINERNYNLAYAYKKQENWEAAIKYFLKISPQDIFPILRVHYFLDLGECYRGQNKYEKALETFLIVENKDPKYFNESEDIVSVVMMGFVLENIADIYSEQENYSLALQYLNKALNLNFDNVAVNQKIQYCRNKQKLNEILNNNIGWQIIMVGDLPLVSGSHLYLFKPNSKNFIKGGITEYWVKVIVYSTDRSDSDVIKEIIEKRKSGYDNINGYKNYSHSLQLWQLKCNKNEIRVVKTLDYDSKGNVLESMDYDGALFDQTVPDTIGEAILNSLCNKR